MKTMKPMNRLLLAAFAATTLMPAFAMAEVTGTQSITSSR